MCIHAAHRETGQRGRPIYSLSEVQHERLHVQLPQQAVHGGVLDNLPLVDDGNVLTEAFGLLQVMRCEDDGSAAAVDVPQEPPHGPPYLDIHPRGRLIQDQQGRLVDERPSDHQATFHPP